jgi:hypothetical protein
MQTRQQQGSRDAKTDVGQTSSRTLQLDETRLGNQQKEANRQGFPASRSINSFSPLRYNPQITLARATDENA